MTRATSSGSTMRPSGYQRSKLLQHIRILGLALVPDRRAHRARQHAVGADAVAAIFLRQRTGEGDHAGFGCAVGRIAERGKAVDRADIDDRAGAARDHLRQHGVRAGVGAVEVCRDVFLPARRVGDGERRVARHAGIVDQQMDVAEASEGSLHRLGRCDVGNGCLHRDAVLAERVGQIVHLVAAVERGDGRAFLAEKAAEPLADAAGRSCDGDRLARELSAHVAPLKASPIQARLARRK